MAGLELATAYVSLTVSSAGIRDSIRDQINRSRPDIDRFGREIGDSIGSGAQQGAREGRDAMRQLRRAIQEASASVEIGADSTEARAALARIRRELSELPSGHALIEIDSTTARRSIERINAQLTQLAGHPVDVSVNADVAGAVAQVHSLGEQIESGVRDGEASMQRLRRAIEQASGNIEIHANASDAEAAVERVMQLINSLPDGHATVEANTAAADAALAAINAELSNLNGDQVDLSVDADVASALASLSGVNAMVGHLDGLHAEVNVDADTGSAAAGLAALNMAANGAGGGISGVRLAAVALAPALLPIAAVGVPAIAALGSAAVGAAGAMGVLALAVKPIIDAFQAKSAEDDAAAQSAQKSAAAEAARAKAITSATEQISSAQQSLANTRASVASAAVNAAERVNTAQRTLATARENAASGAQAAAQRVIKAQEAVRDAETSGAVQIASAQRAISDAREQGARRVSDALSQVGSAERTLASAQQSSLSAQQALNDAREAARRGLEDMNMQLRSASLQERSGVLQVQEARQRLAKTMSDPKATQLEREQAQLSVDQALQGLDETRARRARLAADTAAANKAGVSGSKQVRSAQQSVADAAQRVADAQAGVAKAHQGVSDAQKQAARSVADAEVKAAQTRVDAAKRVRTAQEGVTSAVQAQAQQARQSAAQIAGAQGGVTSALRAQRDQARQGAAQIVSAQNAVRSAQRSLQDAYAKTGTSADAASTKAAQAMAKLSPAGRNFVNFLRKDMQPRFDDLGKTAQTNMLPGFQKALTNLLPLFGPLSKMVADVSKRLGDMAVSASKALTGPFWMKFFTFISKNAGPWMQTFGRIIGNLATGLAGLFMASGPAGDDFTGMIERLTKRFAEFGKNGGGEQFKTFLAYARDSLPKVAAFVGDLVGAFKQVTVALAPMGPIMLGAAAAAARFIADLDPQTIRTMAIVLGSLVGVYKLFTMTVRAAAIVSGAMTLAQQLSTSSTQADTAATNTSIASRVRQTAATVASRIAQIAAAAASRTMAAAQWVLNAALNANPIGLVVVAIAALVAGLVVAYQKSETFRNIVNAAFGAVKNVMKGVLDWITGVFWPGWQRVLKWTGDVVTSAKDTASRALSAMRGAFESLKNWVLGAFKGAWNGVKKVFTWPVDEAKKAIDGILGSKGLRNVFTSVKNWVFGPFKRAWDGLKTLITDPVQAGKNMLDNILGKDDNGGIRGMFNTAVKAVGKIWDKLKGIVTTPINGVIGIMNDPFIRGFNKLGKPFGLHIDELPKIGGKADGGRIPGRAGGGTIPGPWRGPRADNVLGISDKGVPTARVNPGEYITKVSSTQRMERKHPGALAYINRYGTLPGHADGGLVGRADGGKAPGMGQSWQWQWEQVRKAFPQAILTSNYRPGATTRGSGNTQMSYHAIGRAIDVDGPGDTKTQVAKWINAHYAGISHDLLYSGLWGNRGLYMGRWLNQPATTVSDHYNHVHWGLEQASVLAGKAWNNIKSAGSNATDFIASTIFNPLKAGAYKLIDGAVSKFGGGDFTKKILGGIAKQAVDGAISWGNGKSSDAGGDPTGAGSKAAAAWRPQIEQALRLNGITPTEAMVQKWIRQIQTESGGNPNAVQGNIGDINNKTGDLAKGLVQVIGSTFRAYHVPGTPNNVFDPIANLAAGINYARHRYGAGMGYIGQGHGYADGGMVRDVPVFDRGGTLAPGINVVHNKLGRPEPLVRAEDVIGERRGDITVNVTGVKYDAAPDIAREITHELRRHDAAGRYREVWA